MVNLDSYAPPLTPISVSLSHKHAQMNTHLKPLLQHTNTHTDKTRFLFIKQRWQVLNKLFSGTVCVCLCLSRNVYESLCVPLHVFLYNNICMSTFVYVPLPIYIHSCGEFSPHRCVRLCVFVSVWEGRTIGVCGYELSLISRRPVPAKQSWHSAAPTSYLSLGIRH